MVVKQLTTRKHSEKQQSWGDVKTRLHTHTLSHMRNATSQVSPQDAPFLTF